MPGRLVNDPELNAHFRLVERNDASPELDEDGHPLPNQSPVIRVTCMDCEKLFPSKPPKVWDMDLNPIDHSVDKGTRTALLQHALAHTQRPKLRRVKA